MAAAKMKLRITPQTLVWQPELEAWQEVAKLNPSWWIQNATDAERPAPAPPALQSKSRRGLMPHAPFATAPPPARSLLQRLFGRGGKKV